LIVTAFISQTSHKTPKHVSTQNANILSTNYLVVSYVLRAAGRVSSSKKSSDYSPDIHRVVGFRMICLRKQIVISKAAVILEQSKSQRKRDTLNLQNVYNSEL
jgi:hypothetical protein